MARPIGDTPTLYGEEATEFLNKMNEKPTKKQKELSEEIKSQRIAPIGSVQNFVDKV